MDIGRITFGTACAMCHGNGITVAGTPCSCRTMPPIMGGTPNPFTAEIEQLRATVQELTLHNGKLGREVKDLEATVQEQAETISELEHRVKNRQCCIDAAEETIAHQAESLRLKDEAIKGALDGMGGSYYLWQQQAQEALAIQPNPDILRERDARLVESLKNRMDGDADYWLQIFADQIRKGEF